MKFHGSWLTAAITFALAYRVGLHFYFLADCEAWKQTHSNWQDACAYGNGVLDVRAAVATLAPAAVVLLMALLAKAPRLWLVLSLGAVAGGLAVVVQVAWGTQLQALLGSAVALHGPTALAMGLAAAARVLSSRARLRGNGA
jgi:hypothetical protein